MRLLLDTHAFLWACMDPRKLGVKARVTITDSGSEVFVSAVSFWEISLKFALGKLDLRKVTPENLSAIAPASGFKLLPLDAEAAATFHRLPRTDHKDPFDRMLVWQAVRERMKLVSNEKFPTEFRKLGLEVVW